MRLALSIYITVFFVSCVSKPLQSQKINGLSFVASPEKITQEHVNPVVNINANYVALMPFGFLKGLNYPKLQYNANQQWFGETTKGITQYVEELRKVNLNIMLKPQIWVWNGEFTGYIKMTTETDWNTFEEAYKTFILDFAVLAENLNIEMLCIGTELEQFVVHRPKFWTQLIQDIKQVYKGKLTYAANWDEYKRTPFWNDLEYIGVDAYFPVSQMQTPTIDDCKEGWQQHKKLLQTMSKKHNKPILFTEYGYRSTDFTAKEPWNSDHTIKSINLKAQTNATEALFKEFWNEDWFAGGFVWKWFVNHKDAGGINDNAFTPQNKTVETVIKHYYSK